MNNNSKIDYSYIIELFNRKDINSYTKEELELFSELFKNSGYHIDLVLIIDKKLKEKHSIIKDKN